MKVTNINKKIVLVVKSIIDSDIRLLNLLKGLDYNIYIAPNSYEIMKIASKFPPIIILLSLNTPESDGLECLTHIRKDTILEKVPVIMVSEKEDQNKLQESLKQGASAYLIKPIGFTSLYRVIQKLTEENPRENLRARVIFKVDISYNGVKKICYCANLSEKGVFIRMTKPIPINTKVRLAMHLPIKKPIMLDGIVINIVGPDKGRFIEPGICVHFTNIDSKTQQGIQRFVEELLIYDFDSQVII